MIDLLIDYRIIDVGPPKKPARRTNAEGNLSLVQRLLLSEFLEVGYKERGRERERGRGGVEAAGREEVAKGIGCCNEGMKLGTTNILLML